MKFNNRLKYMLLAAVIAASSFYPVPAYAAEEEQLGSEEEAAEESEDTAEEEPVEQGPVIEYEYTPEDRYELPIQSNDWDNWPAGPKVYAESAIVMEASTGTVLYAKNIDEGHYPASITKIMTALLAIENCDMNEEVTFSHNAAFNIEFGSSSIARDEGEILTVEECLYGLLLESANECALALGEHISGDTASFAELMNERAAQLGCTNTHFVTPNGLHDPDHYTTAHDIARITAEAIRHQEFRRISGSARYILRATNKKSEQLWMNNHHYMICPYKTHKFIDETVFAGKTGYTTNALNTLMTCATREGMDLIVITMKTQSSGEAGVPLYTDTAELLNYASQNFHRVNIAENETNFTLGQSEIFHTGTSVFGESAPMIEMDENGYVILPVKAEFTDAQPHLTFLDDSESGTIATLSYTFNDQVVGSTSLHIAKPEIQEFTFGEGTAVPEAPKAAADKKTIRIDIMYLLYAAAAIVSITILILLIRLIGKTFHFSFMEKKKKDPAPLPGVPTKRYKSRKRRRNQRKNRRENKHNYDDFEDIIR